MTIKLLQRSVLSLGLKNACAYCAIIAGHKSSSRRRCLPIPNFKTIVRVLRLSGVRACAGVLSKAR